MLKRLEAYKIPRHLDPRKTRLSSGDRSLGKMFRDREELPASGDMETEIRTAISQSEYMIIVCSRASARSSRVNGEIRQFVSLRDSANILCFIIDGEPSFDAPGINADVGCIPAELRKQRLVTGLIPLAADARSSKDGKKVAVQKLVAGLLNVNLDELQRRDLRRKNVRLMAAMAASLTIALVTTGLFLKATVAEGEATTARAEAEMQQGRAEDLVSFLLDDLASTKLHQLGRVDVMDAVVEKIVDHYADQNNANLSPEALSRKTRAYLQLGQLYLGRDLRDPANDLFNYAYRTTSKLFERYPESPAAVYSHTVSLYWVGLNHIFNGRYVEAEKAWRERTQIGEKLWEWDNHASSVWRVMADMNVHLGWSLMELGRHEEALEQFQMGLKKRQQNAARHSDDIGWLNSVGGGYHHLQWAQQYLGMHREAYENALQSNRLYRRLAEGDVTDQRAVGNYARSLRWLADTELSQNMLEDAEQHLQESLKMHDRLLAFEPENTTFQYQSCVSMVTLAELKWKMSDTDAVSDVLAEYCPDEAVILSLDHFKIHNRFYGYRLAQLKLDMAIKGRQKEVAHDLYQKIASAWAEETEVIRSSLQGQQVGFMLVMQSMAVNTLHSSALTPPQLLADAIREMETSAVGRLPSSAVLLDRARNLLTRTAAADGKAR